MAATKTEDLVSQAAELLHQAQLLIDQAVEQAEAEAQKGTRDWRGVGYGTELGDLQGTMHGGWDSEALKLFQLAAASASQLRRGRK